jgi:hypothetical protein
MSDQDQAVMLDSFAVKYMIEVVDKLAAYHDIITHRTAWLCVCIQVNVCACNYSIRAVKRLV